MIQTLASFENHQYQYTIQIGHNPTDIARQENLKIGNGYGEDTIDTPILL